MFMALFCVLFFNYSFFTHVTDVYPFSENIGFVLSLGVVLYFLIVFLLTVVSSKYTTKPVLIILLLISSLTTYFMNTYNVVIDDSMIRNTLQTNIHESMDLLSIKQILYFVFLGVLPAILVYRADIRYNNFKNELFSKVKMMLLSSVIIALSIFTFSKHYTSFVREHRPLRHYTNPTYWIYSVGNYINKTFNSGPIVVKPLGTDAHISSNNALPKLVIMVVGEAARADHFSLNGYSKQTNPLLEKANIINFSHMYSCGTSTAESVPCMFSVFDKGDYTYKKGITNENVLDVLNHTGKIDILWRDNNSNSKGVADRVPYEDYKTNTKNTICTDGECRDMGMLVELDDYIKARAEKNILIILHQMGNHGPAYYKRYPKEFEKFTPVCETNQLEKCSREEINNAYDNAILYTDYFLSEVITFLKQYDQTYATSMFYMSDHGESLGENGVYLHGLPYFMAPDAQTHIASLLWLGSNMKGQINTQTLIANKDRAYSQDNLFHTLLGIFDVNTSVYDPTKDILSE